MNFVGWIPGKPWHRKMLQELGVEGQMIFSWKDTCYGYGVFEHCEATDIIITRLIKERRLPNPGSFTAIDKDEEQLPFKEQKVWYEKWDSIQAERG